MDAAFDRNNKTKPRNGDSIGSDIDDTTKQELQDIDDTKQDIGDVQLSAIGADCIRRFPFTNAMFVEFIFDMEAKLLVIVVRPNDDEIPVIVTLPIETKANDLSEYMFKIAFEKKAKGLAEYMWIGHCQWVGCNSAAIYNAFEDIYDSNQVSENGNMQLRLELSRIYVNCKPVIWKYVDFKYTSTLNEIAAFVVHNKLRVYAENKKVFAIVAGFKTSGKHKKPAKKEEEISNLFVPLLSDMMFIVKPFDICDKILYYSMVKFASVLEMRLFPSAKQKTCLKYIRNMQMAIHWSYDPRQQDTVLKYIRFARFLTDKYKESTSKRSKDKYDRLLRCLLNGSIAKEQITSLNCLDLDD
eukprot:711111_1